ncbi:MAG TPA: histidine kinase, partial [Chitinophagaceae bacterium]|nr:histidine kinase [Chitinophagaceae bacterium]
LGDMYARQGTTDSSRYYYTQGLNHAEKEGNRKLVCIGHLAVGSSYIHSLEFEAALKHFFTALTIAEELQLHKYIADAKRNIGYVYLSQQNESTALGYFKQAEQSILQVKDTVGLIVLYPDLGYCTGATGDTAGALRFFHKAFDLCDQYEAGSSFSAGKKEFMTAKRLVLYYNMSDFLSSKDLPAALTRMNQLWETVKDSPNPLQQFQLLSIIADLHYRVKEYGKAIDRAEQALTIFKSEGSGSVNELKDIHWTIATSAAELHDYETAYKNLDQFRVYNDSVFNQEKLEAIHSVEAKYESEKKEHQIALLNTQKKNQQVVVLIAVAGFIIVLLLLGFVVRSARFKRKIERKDMEQKMYEMEQTALRAQMNPHFIFNCLNSVQQYVIRNDINKVNQYLATFANLIRQTLENSGKPLIPLKDELDYLDTYIRMEQMRGDGAFTYQFNVEQGVDPMAIYIPNMIVQPFVENSIHHGIGRKKAGDGVIRLTVSKDHKLTFSIEDNGEGFNQSMREKEITEGGHVPMGSSITEKRIAMYNHLHEDKIELEVIDKSAIAGNDSGTKVILKFPLNDDV